LAWELEEQGVKKMGGYLSQEEIDSLLRNMGKKIEQAAGRDEEGEKPGLSPASTQFPGEKKSLQREGRGRTPLVEKVTFAPLKPYRRGGYQKPDITYFDKIFLVVSGELGSAEITVRELLKLEEGSVIKLDKIAGESAAILVNGRQIGQGEVVVINDRFGLRITAVGEGDTETRKEG